MNRRRQGHSQLQLGALARACTAPTVLWNGARTFTVADASAAGRGTLRGARGDAAFERALEPA